MLCHFLEILFIYTFKTAINEFVVIFPSIMSFKIAFDLSKSLNYLLSRYGVKAACQILTLEIPVRVEGTAARSSLVEFHPDLEKF